MDNDTDKPKTSLLSKILGIAGGGISGLAGMLAYTRINIVNKLTQLEHPNVVVMSNKDIELLPQLRKDYDDASSVIGKAVEKARQTAKGNKIEELIKSSTKSSNAEKAALEYAFSKEVVGHVPLAEQITMRNLHFTTANKVKAGIVFATVASITGIAVWNVTSWLHKEKSDMTMSLQR